MVVIFKNLFFFQLVVLFFYLYINLYLYKFYLYFRFQGFLCFVQILIFNFKGLVMILCLQMNFVEFLEQVLEVLKGVEIDKIECFMFLVSV